MPWCSAACIFAIGIKTDCCVLFKHKVAEGMKIWRSVVDWNWVRTPGIRPYYPGSKEGLDMTYNFAAMQGLVAHDIPWYSRITSADYVIPRWYHSNITRNVGTTFTWSDVILRPEWDMRNIEGRQARVIVRTPTRAQNAIPEVYVVQNGVGIYELSQLPGHQGRQMGLSIIGLHGICFNDHQWLRR